jgi:hypothetical protein
MTENSVFRLFTIPSIMEKIEFITLINIEQGDIKFNMNASLGSISNFLMTEWTPEGQADQTPKSLGLRIIRGLRETFVVNENEVLIGLGASGVNL